MSWKKWVGGFSAVEFYKKVGRPKNLKQVAGYAFHGLYGIVGIKIVTLPIIYLGTGVATKEWNLSNHIKSIIENFKEKKENKLEKTIMYEEAIKSLEN